MAIKYSLTSLASFLLLLKCCAAAVMKNPASIKNASSEAVDHKLTRFDEFDWELCKLIYNATHDNVLISPVSLKLLLAILYEGAEGGTAKEIETVLQVSSQEKNQLRSRFSHVLSQLNQESPDYTLHFGTSTFIDESIKPQNEFVGKLKQHYNSSIVKVPFSQPDAVVSQVNSWAKSVSHGYIEKFLSKDDIDENEILMMANILFFKGLWQKPFDVRKTEQKIFHLNSTSGVKTPFMHTFDDFYYLNATELDAQILKLPYLGEQYCMYIILPNKKLELNELMKKLGSIGMLRSYFTKLGEYKVSVSLPKFSFDSNTFLKPFLQQLGMKEMFSEKANLTKISADPKHKLSVTNLLQRTGLEIDESGSTAYAITEAHLANKFGDSYAEFFADHPFLFSIEHDKAKVPVFTGKLSNPANKFSEIESLTLVPPSSLNVSPEIVPKINSTANASNLSNSSTPAPPPPAASNAAPNTPPPSTTNASHVLIAAPASAVAGPAPEPAHSPDAGRPPYPSSAPHDFIRDSHFDTRLLQSIYSARSNENILVSPASVKMTLALLLEGAGGNTASELQDVMRLPRNIAHWQQQLASLQSSLRSEGKNVTVLSANCLFLSQGSKISPRYEAVATNNYQSGVESLDFKDSNHAAEKVNNWVNVNTRGVIDKLITPDDINSDLRMLLVNTLFFKGKWQLGFSPRTTSLRCFTSFNGKCTKVPMMETSAFFNYASLPSLNAQAIELPYMNEKHSMVIILPHTTNGLRQLIRDLPSHQLQSLVSQMHAKKVFVSLPRFSIEHTSKLVPILQSLGLRELFSQNADLTGILSSGEHLAVDKILQKSKLELDEHGTVAASATGTFVIPLSSSIASFDADRPFLFFLRDKESGAILFEGILSDPENFGNDGVQIAESQGEPQINSKIPPASSSAAASPNSATAPLHHLSGLMPSTQFAYNNLNQPSAVLPNSNNEPRPIIASKIPEMNANKNGNGNNNKKNGNRPPIVEYPHSEYYQKPIPNDRDAILFTSNTTTNKYDNNPINKSKSLRSH